MTLRAVFDINDVGPNWILIGDCGGNRRSITNDADAVVEHILTTTFSHRKDKDKIRIFYIDTMGQRDELCHDGKRFTGFAPARAENWKLE